MHRSAPKILLTLLAITSCKSVNSDQDLLASHLQSPAALPNLCVTAQRLIGDYDGDALARAARLTTHERLEAFLESKPEIGAETLSIHAFVPTPRLANSEYPQLWCKLKSAKDLARADKAWLSSDGPGRNCDGINDAFFQAAQAADPALRALVEASPYKITFRNRTFLTGGQWAPSSAKVILEPGRRLVVETTSLESLPGIPRIGGMNYCKLVAPAAFAKLLTDVKAGSFQRVVLTDQATPEEIAPPGVRFARIQFKGLVGNLLSQKADVYWPAGTMRGVYVVSPGGGVGSLGMRGLASAMAEAGQAVFVVHYPLDLAILEKLTLRANSAYALGLLLKDRKLDQLKGLPQDLAVSLVQKNLPLRVFGHSLGGAILGDMLFKEINPFDLVVLYGTSSFIKTTSKSELAVPAFYAFFGQNDGLSLETPDKVVAFREQLQVTEPVEGELRYKSKGFPHFVEIVPELNHFCIVSDMTTGSGTMKGKDRDGPVPSACIPKLVERMQKRGLL